LLPTNLPEASEHDTPATSMELEYDEPDSQLGGRVNLVGTSLEEESHMLDDDTSFSEEIGVRTADSEKLVQADREQAAVAARSGRQIWSKKLEVYVYY